MSNCIEISGGYEKTFSDREIDIAALRAFIDSVKDLPSSPSSGEEMIAWWFLSGASFSQSGAYVTIPFGQSRSTHTWRDFRGTLHLLARFVRKDLKIVFTLRDTDWDNDSRPGLCPVQLLVGGNVLGL